MLIEIVSYVLLGLIAGLLSGLFGLGGGVIIVPGLSSLLVWHQFASPLAIHIAIGSSLFVMIFSTGNSFYQHRKKNTGYWSIYGQLVVGLIPGIIVGALLSHYLHGHLLKIIFGVLVVVIGGKMVLPTMGSTQSDQRQLPALWVMRIMGGVIGVIAALLGVGCGFITVPYLVSRGIETRLAIMVSAMVGCTIGCLGSVLNAVLGWSVAGLPHWSVGYVYWPACVCIIIGTLFTVPLGAKLAYRLPTKQLKLAFGIVLLVIGVHMLF